MPCSRIFFEQRAHLVAFSIGACILARSTFRLVVARRRAASIDKENAGQQAVLMAPEIIFALAYHIAPPLGRSRAAIAAIEQNHFLSRVDDCRRGRSDAG